MTQAEAIAEARPLLATHGAAWPREWPRPGGASPRPDLDGNGFD